MYLITNAMKNLERNLGRNLLLATVMLAIIVSTVVTLTISNASARVIDEIRLDLGSRVEVRQDFISMRQNDMGRDDVSYIPIESFYAFAASDYLSKTIYNADMYAWSGKWELDSETPSGMSNTFSAVREPDPANPGMQQRGDGRGGVVLDETCKLVSTSDPATLPDFGTLRQISAGRMFAELNECIISEELAGLNGLTIGDKIDLRGSIATDKYYTLTIVGIYSDQTSEYLNLMLMFNRGMSENRRNEIITSFDTLIAAGWQSNAGLDMKTYYFLKDPDTVRLFENEVRAIGLPITYNVAINQAAYDKVTGPLSGMQAAITTFMLVILLLGAVVLALISFMVVRERKYEVGVLRAMGMERSKVAIGIIAETLMIATICLLVGLTAGSLIAQPVADSMLASRVAEVEAVPTLNRALFVGGQSQIGDGSEGYLPESEIQISLGAEVISRIILITLALAGLSGMIAIAVISQYEPLKILRDIS